MRFLVRSILVLLLAAPLARAADPTPVFDDGRLGYGMELGIPQTVFKDATSPRTVELLGAALMEPDRTTPQRVQIVKDIGACPLPVSAGFIRRSLTNPEPSIRAEAARSAAKLGDAALCADLKPLLSDKELIVRREAILAGAKLGDPSFVAAGLKESDPLLLDAAISTATIEHAKTIASMLPTLSPTLQVTAIRTLGRVKAKDQSGAVAPHFSGDIPHRVAVAHAVGEMGATDQLTAVEKLLDDSHPTVRREAIAALQGVAENPSIRQKHAIDKLNHDEDRSVREASARLLQANPTADGVAPLVVQLDDDYHPLYIAARDALVAAGKDTIPAATELLDNKNPRRREDGSYLLGQLKSDSGFDRHVELMGDPDWQLVEQVAHSLGQIGRKDAAPTLAKLATRAPTLATEPDAKKNFMHSNGACREAIISCGLLGYAEVLPPILSIIPKREEYSGDLRAATIWVFGMIGDASDAGTQGAMGGTLGDIKEGENVKFEVIKAWGNQRRKAALGIVTPWDQPGGLSGSPNMRWILHWAYERISGNEVPYIPPSGTVTADVSIADIPKQN